MQNINDSDYCILDLQNSPCSNDFLNEHQLNCEKLISLNYFCTNCFLVQVKEFKKANEISVMNTFIIHPFKYMA